MAHDLKACITKLSTEDPSLSVTGFEEQIKVSPGVFALHEVPLSVELFRNVCYK